MQDLRITIVQTPLHWHKPEANRQMLSQKLHNLAGETDLIILPEMFTTGFSMASPALAEPAGGPTTVWLAQMAARLQAVITGSIITAEKGQYFNRLLWMRTDGTSDYYDKRHLFRMAGENNIYSAGTMRLILTLKGWKICPLICYDLRFPVWSRNTEPLYDLLLYVANWPAKRRLAWQTLLPARAIENLAYVAGVNRVGRDENHHEYAGDSALYEPTGEKIWGLAQEEKVQTITLSYQDLQQYRQSFPAFLDADRFKLEY
jgi:omega-amidase